MKRIKPISKCLLAIFMIVAGTMHFVTSDFFLKIMPPYLPLHKELVVTDDPRRRIVRSQRTVLASSLTSLLRWIWISQPWH